jgi:hypothetical protein
VYNVTRLIGTLLSISQMGPAGTQSIGWTPHAVTPLASGSRLCR